MILFMPQNVLCLLDKVRAVALEGKKYSSESYDLERYNKLLKIIAEEYSEILNLPSEEILKQWKNEFCSFTPKVGINIVLCSEKGKILLLKRSDDHKWCFPCGWLDVGEKIFDGAIRECKEETGLEIEPLGYLSISEKCPNHYKNLMYQISINCVAKLVKDNLPVTISHEHLDFKWVNEMEIKDLEIHFGHEKIINLAINFLKDGKFIPHIE